MKTLGLSLLVCLFIGCSTTEGTSDDATLDAAVIVPIDAARWEPPRDARVDARPPVLGLPCAVELLFTKHCRGCHGVRPEPSVPMPLVTYADLTAKHQTGVPMYTRIPARLHDVQRPMPPVTADDVLSAEELRTLEDWIDGGAPASSDTCVQSDPERNDEVDISECEFLPELLAHDGQDQPYEVPLEDNHNECFNFAVPWNEPVQAIAFFPVLDDRRVIHHMALYALESGSQPGTHGHCEGGPNRTILGGWSPGQDNQAARSDYGILMPPDSSRIFQLEIHYNNARRYEAHDRSGLKICATTKLRPKTVAVHLLGSNDIHLPPGRRTDVVNSCVVTSENGPATVLGMSPHMHLLGVHLRTVLKRPDGSEEVLTDKPYSFENQALQILKTPIVVRKGDVLTTVCTYDNTTSRFIDYSEGTDGEMCGNGLLAYPPGSITGGLYGGVLGALGVPNVCMGIGADPVFDL